MLAFATAIMAGQTNVSDWNAVKALPAGAQVRIAAGPRTVTGKIDRVADDVLAVTTGKGQEMFDRQQVSVVSVQKPSHRKRNTLIGLAVGSGAGLGIGIASRPKPDQLQIVSSGEVVGVCTAAGSLVGTIVGVVIPTGGWREIYRK